MRCVGMPALAGAVWLCLLAPAAGRGDDGPAEEEIEALIAQLSSDRFRLREAATEELVKIGPPALPALRKAMSHPDLEVSARARLAAEAILGKIPRLRAELRETAQAHFKLGRYPEMIKTCARLTALPEPAMLDFLWLGHACQLNGDWAKAIEAYQCVVRELDKTTRGDAVEGDTSRDKPPKRPPQEQDQDQVVPSRIGLAMWIARMQRVECGDAKAAAGTLDEALKTLDAAGSGYIASEVLMQLAGAQEAAGQVADALQSWITLNRGFQEGRLAPRSEMNRLLIASVPGLIRRLPAGAAVPQVPGIILLTPKAPSRTFDLDDPAALREAFGAYTPPGSGYWSFALCPPPGSEFAGLTVAVDFEQIKVGYGGWFTCWVRAEGKPGNRIQLANLVWPKGQGPGRKVIKRRIDVPPGAEAVFIRPGRWGGKFKVHTAKVTATFRPQRRPGEGMTPPIWMQTEALPPGGTLTCGDEAIRSEVAYGDVTPGRRRVRYVVGGRAETFEATMGFVPGRRYGLFVNLDSPFRHALTNLYGVDAMESGLSAAPLAGGQWLGAWATLGGEVMYSTSGDLVTWAAPRPLPFNSIFRNLSPSVVAAPDGTVHLAWFSKRLEPDFTSPTGYRLWITGTKDGRRWSKPRPVSIGMEAGSQAEPVQMLYEPAGQFRMFWRGSAGRAEGPEKLHELFLLPIPGASKLHVRHSHVAFDAAGAMHMVFDGAGKDIYYTVSNDGRQWRQPVCILEGPRNKPFARAQLVFSGGAGALLHAQSGSSYLRPFAAGDPPRVGDPVKITNHVAPLNGSRLIPTPGGQVVVFTCQSAPWVLRARVKDLCRTPGEGR